MVKVYIGIRSNGVRCTRRCAGEHRETLISGNGAAWTLRIAGSRRLPQSPSVSGWPFRRSSRQGVVRHGPARQCPARRCRTSVERTPDLLADLNPDTPASVSGVQFVRRRRFVWRPGTSRHPVEALDILRADESLKANLRPEGLDLLRDSNVLLTAAYSFRKSLWLQHAASVDRVACFVSAVNRVISAPARVRGVHRWQDVTQEIRLT